MSNVGYATLQIIPSLQGAGDALTKGIMPSTKGVGDKAGKNIGTSMKTGLLGALKGVAAPLAAVFAGQQVFSFLKDSVGEAREAQKVGAITAQTIKATGGAAKITADQVGDLATAISNKTGMDDEAIQSGANLLLTFKNVRNEVGQGANIFDRATAAAADLSAAGFGDLSGTSKQLGKALNDPLKGLTALSKSGVTFTAEQQKMIKGMVAAGDILGAQKIILGEVEAQVGGVAAASSTAGEKAAVAWGNFKETIGTGLLPLIDKVAVFFTTRIAPALSGFVEGLTNGTGAGGRFAAIAKGIGSAVVTAFSGFKANVLPVIIQFGKYLIANAVPAAQNLYKAIAPLVKQAVELGIAVGSKVLPFLKDLALTLGGGVVSGLGSVAKFVGDNATLFQSLAVGLGAALAVWKAWQLALTIGATVMKGIAAVTKAYTAVQAALNVVMSLNPIGLVVIALVALAAGLIYAWKHSEQFRTVVLAVWAAVKGAVLTAASAVKNAVVTAWNAIKAATSATWNAIKAAISAVWSFIKSYVTGQVNLVKAVVSGAWNGIKAVTSAVWNAIKAAVSVAVGALVGVVRAQVNLTKSIVSGAWNAVKSVTTSVWNGIKGAVSTAISGVVSIVSGIKGRVTGALGNLGGVLLGAGRDLIQGLIRGIEGALGGLKNKLQSVTKLIPDWKGPIDTDRELLTPAGDAIIGSLITGMEGQLPALRKFLGGVSTSIAGGLTARPMVDMTARGLAGAARLTTASRLGANGNGSSDRPINITVSADDPDATARKVGRHLANQGV